MAKNKRQPKSEPKEATASAVPGEGWFAQRGAIYCLLLTSVVAVYGQVYKYNFVTWDDPINVTQNPLLNPVTFDSLRTFWAEPFAQLYIPITYTYFSAEAAIASPNSPDPEVRRRSRQVFHLGNLVLHIGCVLFVFAILRRLVGHDWSAGCGALLFALHPFQAASVSWVSETKGLMAGLFGMAAIWLYLLARAALVRDSASGDDASKASDQQPNWLSGGLLYAGATMAMALALLSKPSATAVPLIIFTLELFVLRPRRWSTAWAMVPWIAMVLAVALVTQNEQSGDVLLYKTPLADRPLVAADSLGFYLAKTAVPWPLTLDYGRSPPAVIERGAASLLWPIPFVLLIVAAIPKDRAIWLTSLGLFTAGVLPVLGLVPFAYQFHSTVADRYVYSALLGPALAFAWWLSRNFSSKRATTGGVLLAVYAVLSFWQSAYWRDDVTLYSHGIAANPRSYVAHNMLGTAYYERGTKQHAQLRRHGIRASQPVNGRTVAQFFDLAEKHFLESIQIRPEHGKGYSNVGLVHLARNRPRKAEHFYRQSIKCNEKSIDGYNGLGFALARQNRHEEALPIYRRAIELAEDVPQEYMKIGSINAYTNLANSLEALGRYPGAVAAYRRIIELSPSNVLASKKLPLALAHAGHLEEAETLCRELLERREDDPEARLNLGQIYRTGGKPTEAIREYNRLLKRIPGYAPAHFRMAEAFDDLRDDRRAVTQLHAALRTEKALGEHLPAALRLLAWKLATCADPAVRHSIDAVEAAESANRATGNTDPLFLDTLAAAYASNAQYDLAVSTAKIAIDKALYGGQLELVPQIRQRLKLYEDGKPYRQPRRDAPSDGSRR